MTTEAFDECGCPPTAAIPTTSGVHHVIITVNEASSTPGEASADSLARHLARLGLEARIISLSATRSDVQPMILSLAADESLDLLVMGGYGHSRLQERVLGGVSRAMLQTMTVPTLMSH